MKELKCRTQERTNLLSVCNVRRATNLVILIVDVINSIVG